MLVLDSVQPEKWYSVKEVSAILGFSEDTVIRQINRGFLKAFVLPMKSTVRRRRYSSRRVQGAEIVRFVQLHMSRN